MLTWTRRGPHQQYGPGAGHHHVGYLFERHDLDTPGNLDQQRWWRQRLPEAVVAGAVVGRLVASSFARSPLRYLAVLEMAREW